MATPKEIDAQVKLEREAIAQGLKKLRENTAKLESQSYASATVYGCTSIEAMLPLVIKRIEETADGRLRQRQAGRFFAEVQQYLSDVEPMAAATIACKVLFDRVFSSDDKATYVARVTEAIGQALENECTDAPLRARSTRSATYDQTELLAPFSGHTAASGGRSHPDQQD